jgi:hypothetical protein
VLGRRGEREYAKVPTQPPLDGLPHWVQITISMLIGVATLGVAFSGYFKKSETKGEQSTTATIAAATLMDNLSIRQLSDQLAHLSNDVVSLERAMGDNTHWTRSKWEQDREVCQRLRELREVLDRLERTAERHLK